MAWNWLSPIPGTLNTQQYRLKQRGMSPSEAIGEDPRRSDSLSPRHSIFSAARLDSSARVKRDKVRERELDGTLDIFWRFEIAR